MVEPLLEHLSNMSSSEFYQELSAWKDTIDEGLKGGTTKVNTAHDTEHATDWENESDVFSGIDPTEAIEAIDIMKMFESETEDLSDNKHIPENYERRDDTVRSAEASGTVATGAPALNRKTKVQERQVDIISVPKLEVLVMMEKYPVQLEDPYLRCRTMECRWEVVRPPDVMYNFVIPSDLARSMQAVTVTTAKNGNAPDKLDKEQKKQGFVNDVVVTIDPKIWKFSGEYTGNGSNKTGDASGLDWSFSLLKRRLQVYQMPLPGVGTKF
ncbi:hypothetical protein PInf_027095 [Phytophthora infestans]|nr:hypothetical protein PInf_027095 [Phytophthora infestans]